MESFTDALNQRNLEKIRVWGLFYVKEAERDFEYTDLFIYWSFCRACNLCMSGLQDTSWVI